MKDYTLYFYQELGDSSEREREPQMIIQIVVPARWMTWFSADDEDEDKVMPRRIKMQKQNLAMAMDKQKCKKER